MPKIPLSSYLKTDLRIPTLFQFFHRRDSYQTITRSFIPLFHCLRKSLHKHLLTSPTSKATQEIELQSNGGILSTKEKSSRLG